MLCFFPRIFIILGPLPRQFCAAIGCTENGQQMRMTVHSYQMSFPPTCREWVTVNRKKNTIFNEHPVYTGGLLNIARLILALPGLSLTNQFM